ncbi:MAG: CopG family transcriptional regulator [Candidatus Omnitrophota bacterium]
MTLTRTTVYLDPKIHRAIKMRAAQMSMSVSEVISEALRLSLKEDAVDLGAIQSRVSEPSRSYEAVLKDLKKDGLL